MLAMLLGWTARGKCMLMYLMYLILMLFLTCSSYSVLFVATATIASVSVWILIIQERRAGCAHLAFLALSAAEEETWRW